MENCYSSSCDDPTAAHFVPKRVAALRAEINQTRRTLPIQKKTRRRISDYKPSPLVLPPVRKKSSKRILPLSMRPVSYANIGGEMSIPKKMAGYSLLPPIKRRKASMVLTDKTTEDETDEHLNYPTEQNTSQNDERKTTEEDAQREEDQYYAESFHFY